MCGDLGSGFWFWVLCARRSGSVWGIGIGKRELGTGCGRLSGVDGFWDLGFGLAAFWSSPRPVWELAEAFGRHLGFGT